MDAIPAAGLINIDGQPVPFSEGQTILQAALAAGLDIPRLCHRPELPPIGSCRLCVVEVGGRVMSACTTPAADGQQIASAKLDPLRARLVELLLAQGRHFCLSCERSGDCRLQATTAQLGANATPQPTAPPRDDSHPALVFDPAHCILCGVCVEASRLLDGKAVFAFAHSGIQTRLVVNSASGLLADSAAAAEDQAVRLCPTGALFVKFQPQAAPLDSFDGFGGFDMGDWGR